VLTGLAIGSSSAATQLAVGAAIGQLISNNAVTGTQALADIAAAIASKVLPAITVTQNVVLLEGIASTGGIAGGMAAGTGFYARVAGHQLTASQAMANIAGAVSGHDLTADQAIPLIVGFAAQTGSFGQLAAGTGEISALVSGHQITADQALT